MNIGRLRDPSKRLLLTVADGFGGLALGTFATEVLLAVLVLVTPEDLLDAKTLALITGTVVGALGLLVRFTEQRPGRQSTSGLGFGIVAVGGVQLAWSAFRMVKSL